MPCNGLHCASTPALRWYSSVRSGYFRRLNPAREHTLGFRRAEMLHRPFINFVHPDDRERTLAQKQAVREGGRAVSFENRYRCKDDSYRWLRWNCLS